MGSEDGSKGVAEPPVRPTKRVRLAWAGEGLAFRGGVPGGAEVVVDGDGAAGPSPMDALLLSLAGCMGADVRHILERSRVPMDSLEVEVEGIRAATHPRRYEGLRLVFRVRGPGVDDRPRLERAVELSREKYCCVLHSLRPEMALEIGIERL